MKILDFKDRKFIKKLGALALPIILQNLIINSLNMVDTIMIGNLGDIEVAAVGVANQFFLFYSFLFMGVASAVGIYTAQFWGAKNEKGIRKSVVVGGVVVTAIGMIFTVVGLLFPRFIISIFSNDAVVLDLGAKYLFIVAFTYVINALSAYISAQLRSMGNSRIPMYGSAIALSLNTVLNYCLIFGELGFPRLGVEGAAIATLISRCVECIIILGYGFCFNKVLKNKIHEYLEWDKALAGKLIKAMIPVVLNEGCFSLALILYTAAYGKLGPQAIAATQITNIINNLFMVFCIGVAISSQVMIGNEIGAENCDVARTYSLRFGIISFALGFVIGGLVIACSPVILSFFNVSLDVANAAKDILIYYGIIAAFKAFNLTMILGVFRAYNDTVYPLKVEAFTMWCLGIPVAFIAAGVLHM